MGGNVRNADASGKEPGLGVQKHLFNVWPLKLSGAYTSLVGSKSLHSLIPLVIVGPESGSGEVAGHLPPYERSGDYCDKSGRKVDGLPGFPVWVDNVAEPVRYESSNDGGG